MARLWIRNITDAYWAAILDKSNSTLQELFIFYIEGLKVSSLLGCWVMVILKHYYRTKTEETMSNFDFKPTTKYD